MKYMQNTHDYYWLYGIICVNLQSLLAIVEWIEMFQRTIFRSGSNGLC